MDAFSSCKVQMLEGSAGGAAKLLPAPSSMARAARPMMCFPMLDPVPRRFDSCYVTIQVRNMTVTAIPRQRLWRHGSMFSVGGHRGAAAAVRGWVAERFKAAVLK